MKTHIVSLVFLCFCLSGQVAEGNIFPHVIHEIIHHVGYYGLCRQPGWYKIQGNCYKFFHSRKTFEAAEAYCRLISHGGHLASIHNPYQNRKLKDLIYSSNHANPRTWIGGKRKWGRFVWTDHSPWTYSKWVPGEPNNAGYVEQCVEMNWSYVGRWNDCKCYNRKPFICEYHPN
ncbi:lectin-like [Protopterus annectens]|uniref:lectin-like n=1 Tax=Protopterus annectens TaxID=7888 RepID=UPI001CFBB238|nr:lectin-like [Protopterus annectens]